MPKITELPELGPTEVNDLDVLAIDDVSAGATKKIAVGDLKKKDRTHFATFSDFTTWAASISPATDQVVWADGIGYRYIGGSTTITGANGWTYLDGNQPHDAGLSAANIIVSNNEYKVTGVPLKKIVGKNYAPSTDAGAILNSVLPTLFGDTYKYRVYDPDGLHLGFATSVDVVSNWWMETEKTLFERRFSQRGNKEAMFRANDDSTRISNVRWKGGKFDVFGGPDIAIQGSFLNIYADDSWLSHFDLRNWQQGSAGFFRGDNLNVHDIFFDTPDLDPGTEAAGIRLSKGNDSTFTRIRGRCPNDGLMFVIPVTVTDDEEDDVDLGTWIRRCRYIDCYLKSYRAKEFTFGVSNATVVPGFTGGIVDSGVAFSTGYSGRYGVRIIADGTDKANAIDRVYVKSLTVEIEQDNAGIESLQIAGEPNTIGSVFIDDLHSFNTGIGTNRNLWIEAEGAKVYIKNIECAANDIAFNAVEADRIEVSGRAVFNKLDGANTDPVLKLRDTFTGVVKFFGKPEFIGVTNRAVDVDGGSLELLQGATANKFVGATGTEFARVISPGSLTYYDDIDGTVDSYAVSSTGERKIIYPPVPVRPSSASAAVIASGQVTIAYQDAVIDTEASAASDNLDGIILPSWARDGMFFTLRTSNNGRDVVVRHNQSVSGGALAIQMIDGINQTMTTTTDRLVLYYNGVTLQQTTFLG